MNSDLVITGCGVVGPAGLGVERFWQAAESGQPTHSPLRGEAFDALGVRFAGALPADVEPRLRWPGLRIASLMALAADEAIARAGWQPALLHDRATGLCAATSKGDLAVMCRCRTPGREAPDAFDFLRAMPDGPGGQLARHYRMIGPRIAPVAACATGTHALIRAARLIADGEADRVLVVAGDASISPLLLGAFTNLGVLTVDQCRPFDRDRTGFFVGEGAAAVTIERADRSAGVPLVHLAGWLIGADPTGLTAQDATGRTLARAITILLSRAHWRPSDVTIYSAHGTATASNDQAESSAIASVFGAADQQPVVAAGKPVFGHMLAAAGLTEAVLTIQAMRRGVVPPISTLRTPDERCRVRWATKALPASLPTAICTSLGFGGQIGLLAIRRCD